MAWEVLIGIGNGALINEVNGLEAAQIPVGAEIIELYTDSGVIRTLELIGTGAWLVALGAAGIAQVREGGAPWSVFALLFIAAMPIAWHVAPFGQIGLALFIAAIVLVMRNGEWASGVPSRRRARPRPTLNSGDATEGELVLLFIAGAVAATGPTAPAGATTAPKRCGEITVRGKDFAVRGHLLPCRFSRRQSRAFLAEGTHRPGWTCRRYPRRLTRIAFSCRKGGRDYYAIRR